MKSGLCSGFCRPPQPTSFRFEQELQVCRSSWTGRRVSPKAVADVTVVMEIPGERMDGVADALAALELPDADRNERHHRLFWTRNRTIPNTVILFLGEFKKAEGNRNQNQLVLDFGTAQQQRRCLGLPNAVIWGITCASGNLKVYSSMWTDRAPFVSPSIMVLLISAQLGQVHLLVPASHMELNGPNRPLALLLLSLQAVRQA
jgi:hypothetical protein